MIECDGIKLEQCGKLCDDCGKKMWYMAREFIFDINPTYICGTCKYAINESKLKLSHSFAIESIVKEERRMLIDEYCISSEERRKEIMAELLGAKND